ncbi:hypothetical protein HHK36_001318 [Tetracentron sinense]|uniref:DCD domain-containing protein n=1 Tax=Tetracentron sinense TaxID=13715 RepID=A0A834ZSN7_TETSI|nr:hypothetical protein HHK36_001318 [Tetracentron sinense]
MDTMPMDQINIEREVDLADQHNVEEPSAETNSAMTDKDNPDPDQNFEKHSEGNIVNHSEDAILSCYPNTKVLKKRIVASVPPTQKIRSDINWLSSSSWEFHHEHAGVNKDFGSPPTGVLHQGYVQVALVLDGVDVTGPHLHTIYPHGSTDTLPFATMGSGSLAAMSVFESKYREDPTINNPNASDSSIELSKLAVLLMILGRKLDNIHVDSVNKQGLLLEVVQVLTDMDFSISNGYISSYARWFMDVLHLLDQFEDVFAEPHGLPPKRNQDHHIPLLQESTPTNVRPYSDQLRLQSTNFANLSINDSIWGNSFTSKKTEERRNFDIRVGGDRNSSTNIKPKGLDFNGFNNGWKINGSGTGGSTGEIQKNSGFNGVFNKGISPKPGNINTIVNSKNSKSEGVLEIKGGRKNNSSNNSNSKNSVDKRFKTLPPAESLSRDEIVGGYIFVCNNDTMQENLKRQLFGLPPRYRDSVRAITPGLPLFLYNYSTHQLHGIFEAASFGGTNIDPTAWEDKKCSGESRFPAQVRVVTRKICEPLEEDSFRPILYHYDGPKFRLELNIPEALALLDIFAEDNA